MIRTTIALILICLTCACESKTPSEVEAPQALQPIAKQPDEAKALEKAKALELAKAAEQAKALEEANILATAKTKLDEFVRAKTQDLTEKLSAFPSKVKMHKITESANITFQNDLEATRKLIMAEFSMENARALNIYATQKITLDWQSVINTTNQQIEAYCLPFVCTANKADEELLPANGVQIGGPIVFRWNTYVQGESHTGTGAILGTAAACFTGGTSLLFGAGAGAIAGHVANEDDQVIPHEQYVQNGSCAFSVIIDGLRYSYAKQITVLGEQNNETFTSCLRVHDNDSVRIRRKRPCDAATGCWAQNTDEIYWITSNQEIRLTN